MTERPFFSIIMPVYNRAAVVGRAIGSCLSQDFRSFEIVAVDDASSDDSAAAIRAFSDPRVRLVVHEKNRGCGPARNTGMAAARGEWLVFLDSDDELLPGALEAIHRRAAAAGPEIGGLRFMCRDEHGTSPDPPYRNEVFAYEDYLRWLDVAVKQEALPCARASTFPGVRYTDSHTFERWYHLEMARNWRVQNCSDVVRRYHHDVADRLTIPTPERGLRYAPDLADDDREVLRVHGEALRRLAPATYRALLSEVTTASFMAGRRLDGLRHAARAWLLMPASPQLYAVVALGLVSRRLVAELKSLRARIQRARATR